MQWFPATWEKETHKEKSFDNTNNLSEGHEDANEDKEALNNMSTEPVVNTAWPTLMKLQQKYVKRKKMKINL